MLQTFRKAFQIEDIRRKILYTLAMLFVVRLGSQLPTPGVDPTYIQNFFANQTGDSFNFFNAFTGGSFETMSIFAFSITPYITSSIIIPLLSIAIPKLEEKQKEELSALLKNFPKEYTKSIFISAKERKQTDELQKMLINAAHLPTVTQNDIIVTNVRHYEALSKALDAIHRVQDGLDSHISGDFLSQDIRECIFFISDIAGEVTNDMILQNIFQHFCIGK